MEDYERTLASINEVFVFKIPPQRSASGHRCAVLGLSMFALVMLQVLI